MNSRPTTVERAYQLARTGECRSVSEIKKRLRDEGFFDVNGQLYGPWLAKDLRRLCGDAKASQSEREPESGSA